MSAEDRRKHLDFVQAAIARMASASSTAKTWLLPVVAATYGYSLAQRSGPVALLGVSAVVLFAFLDASYLRQERAFRALYRSVVAGRATPYNMDNSVFYGKQNGDEDDQREENCQWYNVIWSWSLAGFYLPFTAVGVLIFVLGGSLTR